MKEATNDLLALTEKYELEKGCVKNALTALESERKVFQSERALLKTAEEALEFYASAERYILVENESQRVVGILEREPGDKARAALAKIREGKA